MEKINILHVKRLINKKFGVIFGDDLDKVPTEELIELSKGFKNRDFLRGGQLFHPGVLLAVSEEFERVNIVDGTWWIMCQDGEFDVEVLKLIIPA